ncbi:MAG: hypothetical protein M3N21_08920 [Actinomycetota bacterium]|nr:hypothetical protein [Actinomycetota bacterium]
MPRRRLRPDDATADPAPPGGLASTAGVTPPTGIAPIRDILPGTPPAHPTPQPVDEWLLALPGLPRPVHRVVPVACRHHEGEPTPWSRVEADAKAGVALRRCEACDDAVYLLDSARRWTAPPLWACPTCGESEIQLVAGLSLTDDGRVSWVVLAGQCGGCHHSCGLTDLLVDDQELAEVLAAL